ncbi:transposase, partial [Rhodohalobacter sp. SW132]|uniref:transposase n=1 Tax=Rhodohalobacter sp. SW132 TaxID=2293433 RepID=UPI0018F4EA1D
DRYECSQGEYLPYRSISITGNKKMRVYRTFAKQCKNCPIKAQCITSKVNYKQLKHSEGKEWYDLMEKRLHTSYGRQMVRKRKAIVEPALGNLLHQNGMKKVYARGIQAANKHVMLASM